MGSERINGTGWKSPRVSVKRKSARTMIGRRRRCPIMRRSANKRTNNCYINVIGHLNAQSAFTVGHSRHVRKRKIWDIADYLYGLTPVPLISIITACVLREYSSGNSFVLLHFRQLHFHGFHSSNRPNIYKYIQLSHVESCILIKICEFGTSWRKLRETRSIEWFCEISLFCLSFFFYPIFCLISPSLILAFTVLSSVFLKTKPN